MTNEERKDAERVQLEQAVHAEDAAGRRYVLVDSRVLAQLREQAAGGCDDRVLRAAGVSREQADAAARAVDLDALPKALSKTERIAMFGTTSKAHDARVRALALIDALTEQGAQQAAQIVLDGQRIAELEARAEGLRRTSVVGQLEAKMRRYEETAECNLQRAIRAKQKLADANALITTFNFTHLGEWYEAHERYLTGQPAAPSRTEAEQAVLDAAAAIHPRALKRPLSYVGDWEEFCEAELARRGLK